MKRYKEDQRLIELELQEYTDADEQYHITAKTILSLAKRALEIFTCSEVPEKQEFLSYFLQNAQLNGNKLEFTLRNPFNLLAEYASRPNWLRLQNAFRTLDWLKIKEDFGYFQSSPAIQQFI